MEELYDLILMGLDAEVADRKASINSIAELLGIDEAKIEHIFDKHHKVIVKHGLQLHEARHYQKQILRHGGFCNYRVSPENDTKLELAPIEVRKDDIVFNCPACNYHEKVSTVEELPINCPECGVIPSKYIKIAALKSEREMIKKRLLSNQQSLEQQARDLAERQAQEDRRKKMEEEIRKELGLSTLLNSRFRLFGSAALFWILGVGMGAAGVGFYVQMRSPQDDWPVAALSDKSKTSLRASPQQETLQQVASDSTQLAASLGADANRMPNAVGQVSLGGTNPLSIRQAASILVANNSPPSTKGQDAPGQLGANSLAALQSATAPAGGGKSPPSNDQLNPAPQSANRLAAQSATALAGESSASSLNAQSTAALDGKALLQEMRLDREWELFLASEAERLAKLRQPSKAFQSVQAINSVELKFNTLGKLAGHYLASNDFPEYDKVLGLAASTINGYSDVAKQADGFGRWSANLWGIGEKAKSLQNLNAAVKLVSSISNIAEKAKGLASLASYQAKVDQWNPAQTNFQQANQLILSIGDPATKLHTYVHLALCYAESGDKDIAASILIKIVGNLSRIKDEKDKPNLIGEIAGAFADIGQADYAMATLDKLDSQLKDKMLFSVTRELAYTNQPIDGLKGLDRLVSPEYQSRAAALLSLFFHYRAGLSSLSASLQEKSIEAEGRIASPQTQAVVRGEISRYLAHAGLAQEAGEWAGKALESARAINNAQDRDIAFAWLAANFARAKQSGMAKESVAKIKDAELADIAAKDIAGINRIFSD